MKAGVIYNGVPSMVCASFLAREGLNIDLFMPRKPGELKSDGFEILPYELPIIGLEHRDYDGDLFGFIGLGTLKKQVRYEKDVVSMVFGSNRIDLSYKSLIDDISRIFPEHAAKVSVFVEELRSIEGALPPLWKVNRKLKGSCHRTGLDKLLSYSLDKKYNRSISSLYNKHRLPSEIRLIFNSVLFVFSGTFTEEIPVIDAARIISLAMDGVYSSETTGAALSCAMLNSIKDSISNISIKDVDYASVTSGIKDLEFGVKNMVLDSDVVKRDFVSHFNLFNSRYSLKVRYPMSMFFRFESNNIPAPLSKFLIYVDIDDAGFYSEDDIYVLNYNLDGEQAVLRITAFISYGLFDIEEQGHRKKFLKMKNIVEDLIPALTIFDYECYPDPKNISLKNEVEYMFTNLVDNDLIYGNIYNELSSYPSYKDVLSCGRESFYPLGFESSVISGLKAANSFMRGLRS